MAQTAAAQQNASVCTGVVVDEEGEPLTGATIRVDGTNIATAADIDGNFSLSNVKPGATLTISYVGMSPVQVKWNGTPLKVTMTSDSNVLDEVVIMGYGITQKRAKVTNSIAKVSEDVLTIGTNANPAQALAGAVSGVKVTVNSGAPGATPNITIRGGTNWDGAASNPLVVVDGQIRDSMADINPNDIETMDVLKDAGATALYGARAANGVILITTKQGKKGTGRVTANVKLGVTNYSSGYKWADAETYLYWSRMGTLNIYQQGAFAAGYNALFGTGNGNSTGNTTISDRSTWNILTLNDDNKYLLDYGWQTMPDPLNEFRGTDNYILFRETDPIKHNLLNNTLTQDYNLSFSGGNDRGSYYASLGYYDADGAITNAYYKRYSFSFSGGYKIANWLEANSVLNYVRADYNNTVNGGQSMGYIFGRIAALPHTIRMTNEDGDQLYALQINGQSVNTKFQPDKFVRNNQTDKFQMTQSLTATIIPGLTLKGAMSWFYSEGLYDSFNKDYVTNAAGSLNTTRSTSQSFERTFTQTYNLVANFNRTFADKHTVGAIFGIEYYDRKYKSLAASGYGAPTDDFGNLQYTDQGEGARSMSNYTYQDRVFSYFGRLEYDYMDKYLVAATFREDGYSRLMNNRWGFFPGVSAGWVFTKENFWAENQNLSWLNYGKLRASFGLNGIVNPNVIGWYTLQGSYSSFKYNGNIGFRIAGLPNPNLRWERTRTFDIGIDFGFLNNQINLIATYYNRLTMDKYASLSLPQTTGFSSVTNNNGSFRNQGVEIEVSATPVRTKDFQWTIGANITYNKNVIVSLPDNGLDRNRQGGQQVYTGNGNELMWVGGYQEGQEPNIMWGWKKAGMIRSEADLAALGDYIDVSNSSSATPALYANESGYQRLVELGRAGGAIRLHPGDLYWKDVNGDNMIDQYDMWKIGNRMPHWSGGFNTRLSWKGLSLYARFDMGFDFRVYDATWCWVMSGGQGAFSMLDEVKKTWTPENPNAKLPVYQEGSQLSANNWLRLSDFNTKPGNYLACREVSLSYEFPSKITQKFRCQGLTLSVTGQNLGYLKKTSLPLPDANNAYAALSSDGSGTYNLPKSFIFGINISF